MPATIDTLSAKRVLATRGAPARHWVGDGFPVHGLFGYSGEGVAARSPFLLLDYAAPTEFSPTTQRRGVGSHPHRGFETVTIVFDGEVEHRDSSGGGGVIRAGDVQWMTAGGGIIHEEFHSSDYAARGGPFEMVQLWVNLPARDKMTPARYQAITDAQIRPWRCFTVLPRSSSTSASWRSLSIFSGAAAAEPSAPVSRAA